MSKITRRETLTRGGQAVAAAAVRPVRPRNRRAAGREGDMTAKPDNRADDELLTLETKLVDANAVFEAKKGKTDDEVEEFTARMYVLEWQFARMPAHTLDGVAAKLRRLHYSKHRGGGTLPEKPLVRTALAGLEQAIEAGGVL